MPSEETIDSLTDAMRGIMEILSTHALLLAHITSALNEAGIEVPHIEYVGMSIH